MPECPHCHARIPEDAETCRSCGRSPSDPVETLPGAEPRLASEAPPLDPAQPGDRFRTLESLGRLISAIGWLYVGLALVAGIYFSGKLPQQTFAILLAAAFGALNGVLIVGAGQLIACIVAIERNTRETRRLLAREQEGSQT